jgi:hypothetical protein
MKKMRINMMATDYILELQGDDDYHNLLLDNEACCELVRDFDVKARMNVCGIVQYEVWKEFVFEGVVSNWDLTTFPKYNPSIDTICGRNRKQIYNDVIVWYYGQRVKT